MEKVLLILCTAIVLGKGLPVNTTNGRSTRGLSQEEFAQMEACVTKYKLEVAKAWKIEIKESDINDTLLGDVAVNLEQCKQLRRMFHRQIGYTTPGTTTAESQTTTEEPTTTEEKTAANRGWNRYRGGPPPRKGRSKRSAYDFEKFPYLKWQLPIKYHIKDGYFNEEQVSTIREAVKEWEEGTCLRFNEVEDSDPDQRIEITGLEEGCYSYIGKTNIVKQVLNLEPGGCTNRLGTAIHEFGHAVGLFHEHARTDRDNYIVVNTDNIQPNRDTQFVITDNTVNMSVPYDYSSVMHYSSNSFAISSSLITIMTKDPKYQYTIGQRIQASFMDQTIVNRMYGCECDSSSLSCNNGGYPDPGTDSTCSSCMCPSGLKDTCTKPADGSPGCSPLSGELTVTDVEQCVQSPGYGVVPYTVGDNCAWLLKADAGRQITTRFDLTDGFGVYYVSSGKICYHYVEIKHNGNLTESGARYCGSANHDLNQQSVLTSVDNKVLINFRSDIKTTSRVKTLGFKLCYKLVEIPTTEATTAEPTTAAPTTAAPTTAAPTTAAPTTAAPTTAEPTTAAPTTAAPTTAAPTTAAPTTAAPTTTEPTTATPTTAEPTTAEPTTAEPTTAAPTTAAPTTAEPTTAEPTTAEPTTAEPTTAAPTTAAPTTAAPTTAEPTTAEPTTSEPTTAEPTTAAPTTAEPTTAEPTTAEPTTAAPTTAAPTTAEPTTAAPTTAKPTTAAPTTTEATTAEPTTAEATTAEATTADASTAAPTTAEATTAEATTAEPITSEPTTAEPTTAEPTTAQPTTAEPTTAEPTTAEPTTIEPTTAAPTTAEPTTAEPTTAQPITAEPTTAAPTTAAPTTAAPTTAEPTTVAPTTAAPTTAKPNTQKGPKCYHCKGWSNRICVQSATIKTCEIGQTCASLSGSGIVQKGCLKICPRENVMSKGTHEGRRYKYYCCSSDLCNNEITPGKATNTRTTTATTQKPTTKLTTIPTNRRTGPKCYQCKGWSSTSCIQAATIRPCEVGQTCASLNAPGMVQKGCLKNCPRENVMSKGTHEGRRYKYYCCSSDLCNLEITPKVSPPKLTTSKPTTQKTPTPRRTGCKCYQCKGWSSTACMQAATIRTCEVGQSCASVVVPGMVQKGCIKICPRENVMSQVIQQGSRYTYYCCSSDLCNKDITPNNINRNKNVQKGSVKGRIVGKKGKTKVQAQANSLSKQILISYKVRLPGNRLPYQPAGSKQSASQPRGGKPSNQPNRKRPSPNKLTKKRPSPNKQTGRRRNKS